MKEIILAIFSISLILSSCTKELPEKIGMSSSKTILPTEINQGRHIFAEALAKSLNDPDVRQFVKQKVSENTFTYENEVLYSLIKNEEINGLTFAEILTSNSNEELSFFNDVIVSLDPL